MMEDFDALPSGYVLDSYQIKKTLGRGGFGITYLAEDMQLRSPVAIKEFMPMDIARRLEDARIEPATTGGAMNFAGHLSRFHNEAQKLAVFDHPNIVRVRRLLEANGTCYCIMDYIEGRSLNDELLDIGRLPAEGVMLMLEKLIDGLRLVHRRNLIHRDIKPGNIMICQLTEPVPISLPSIPFDIRVRYGRPVLIDFGSARAFSGDEDRSMTGFVSHGYAPPEQYGVRVVQDTRSDIYSLAAVAYACLAGEKPVTPSERSMDPSLMPPAAARFQGLAPAAFLHAIDQALSIRPNDRPQSLEDWSWALFGIDPSTRQAPVEPPPEPDGPTVTPAPASASGDPATPFPPGAAPAVASQTVPPPGPATTPPAPVPARGRSSLLRIGLPLAVVVLAVVGGAYWYLQRDSAQSIADLPLPDSGTMDRVEVFNVPPERWTPVDLTLYGIQPGEYTVSADGPFRMRVNGQVYTVDGNRALDLSSEPSTQIELKAIGQARAITVQQP